LKVIKYNKKADGIIYFLIGHSYYNIYDEMNALKYYKLAIDNKYNVSAVFYYRGIIYFETKQYYEAVNDFSKVIELDPKNFQGYLFRGKSYYLLRYFKKALSDLLKVSKIKSNLWEVSLQKGYIYLFHKKNYQKALDNFNQLIAIKPKLGLAHYYRGVTNFYLNKCSAIRDFYTYRELEKNIDSETDKAINEMINRLRGKCH
ncbi:MAG: tetratricopeptide repeat protein, partial [Spirochaetota bacterium]|nr:tetratricopeptide repeat protein [Spirochaetota bacterium]